MTSPGIILRNLTFNFARSVSFPDQIPQTMQVLIFPLATATFPAANGPATFVDPTGVQEVLLNQPDNPVTFQLVPSSNPNLSTPVNYRAAWRAGGVTGELTTYDFAMPDQDIDFEDLSNLGMIINSEVYLQQTDLGVPGRVARLNDSGDVVDSSGTPVATSAALTALQNSLTAETLARETADATVTYNMTTLVDAQFNQAISTSQANITALQTSLGGTVDASAIAISVLQTQMPRKADLDSTNHIPINEIPRAAITDWIPVATIDDMLALQYPDEVQSGDVVLVGAGPLVYGFTGSDPSRLADWILLNRVTSVNSKQGDIVLTAADVGAVDATTGTLPIGRVTGLTSALSGYATTTSLTTVANQVSAIQNDTTIVRTTGGTTGTITDDVLPANIALVNDAHQVTDKNGAIVAAGGAVLSVNNKTGNVVLGAADVGAIASGAMLAQSQITGLTSRLTTDENNISALQTQVNDLGPGTGGGAPAGPTEYWQAAGTTTDFAAVTLHSPWGVDHDGSVTGNAGTPYNTPSGATSSDVCWAYISENGHLHLRQWNESGPPDPVHALQSDLTTLQTTVGTKASQSDVTSLTTTVGTKANQSDVTTLTTTVGTKANQSALDTTNANVSAIQTALPAKADLVSGNVPLNQLPTTTLSQQVLSSLAPTLAAKADLVSGKLQASELPTNIPESSVQNLVSDLAGKASLIGGVVPLAQLPSVIFASMVEVANKAAMLALTTGQVAPGWMCGITSTADQGTYMLIGSDPAQFANWMQLPVPLAPVLSVNGSTGTVWLQASDVGALAANAMLPISQVTNLQTTLNNLATTAAVNAGLAGVTTPAQVQSILSTSTEIKQKVNYVSTTNIASLSGQQSADGVLMAVGSTVLLTAQSSSIQNGTYTVNSSAWTRTTDMASGAYFVKGSLVVVAAGSTKANTLWQCTSSSGLVDTNANNWSQVGSVAPPYAPIQGNGISITGSAPTQTFTAVTQSGGGCQVTSNGIALDPAVAARKKVIAVPAGSTTPTLTHNLNTTTVFVALTQVSAGTGSLIGWTAVNANNVSLEFSSAPASGQWAALILG